MPNFRIKSFKFLFAFLGGVVLTFILFFNAKKNKQISHEPNHEVSIYDSAKCAPGVNSIIGSLFVDMEGKVIKKRKSDFSLTIDSHRYAGKIGLDSFALFYDDSILWKLPIGVHHELLLDDDSNIIALGFEHRNFRGNPNRFFEVLFTINLSGQILRKQSFFTMVSSIDSILAPVKNAILTKNRAFVKKVLPQKEFIFDSSYFHINSIQILPKNELEKIDTTFSHGNLLISDFMNNYFAIIDRNDFHIKWIFIQKESFMGQHGVRMLSDGRIVFFLNNLLDSLGNYYSSVRIINPLSKKMLWEFTGIPKYSLHSVRQGHCQYLNNRNILITVNNDLTGGETYAMEVTPNYEIVWKWKPSKLPNLSEGFYRVERVQFLK